MGCWSVGVLNSPLRCLPSIHYSITPIVQFCCCCGGTHEASVFYNGTMQVRVLPAAPLPGGVKVARRPVKPFGVGASPPLAAIFASDQEALDPSITSQFSLTSSWP